MSIPFVDEDDPGEHGAALIRQIRAVYRDWDVSLMPVPGLSVVLTKTPSVYGFVIRDGTVKFVQTVESFERDWLVHFIIKAGGGPHVKVRTTGRKRPNVGETIVWLPGEDAEDAFLILLASHIMLY